MFFCVFRFGSRDGPQPVSKQSLMSFSAVGQGTADFLPVDFFLRVLLSLSGAKRLMVRTMSVSRIPILFIGGSLLVEVGKEREERTAYITTPRGLIEKG